MARRRGRKEVADDTSGGDQLAYVFLRDVRVDCGVVRLWRAGAARHAPPADDDSLKIRQRGGGFVRLVIAMHGDDGCDLADFVQYPQFAHVARVQDEVNVLEDVRQAVVQRRPSLRYVCVRDDSDPCHKYPSC